MKNPIDPLEWNYDASIILKKYAKYLFLISLFIAFGEGFFSIFFDKLVEKHLFSKIAE